MDSEFFIKPLTETATAPTRGSEDAAGYDLYADTPDTDIIVPAHGKAIVKTGLSMAIPQHHYGRIAPRSGLAWKHFIDVGAGVIDRDYRGEVGVVLYNFSDIDYLIKHKDRIAQIILTRYITPPLVIITEDELPTTERGSGGYGSTGVSTPSK